MRKYWDIVKRVIAESDIVLEVLDARFIEETRNKPIEAIARERGKELICVLNKADLVDLDDARKKAPYLKNAVFVSSTKNLGTTILRRLIRKLAPADNKTIKIGVVGYPNTGKSSLINVLKQRKSAKTSPVPGYTKGVQLIKIEEGVFIIDTPGVVPYSKNKENSKALIAAISAHNLDDPELAAFEIMRRFKAANPEAFEIHYGVKLSDDFDDVLEKLAKLNHRVKKGGLADTRAVAVQIVDDWQRGRIGL